MTTPRRLTVALFTVLALVAAACGNGQVATGEGPDVEGREGPTIVVGSNDFAESRILAHVYALALEAEGFPVDVRENIGSREITFPALTAGELDLMPEYTGNAYLFAVGEADTDLRGDDEVYQALVEALEAQGLAAGDRSDAEDVDGLAVTRETAEEHGLEKISDIADFPGTFRFGAGPECAERMSCWRGYQEVYGLDNMELITLDAGGPITVEALNSGEVDGANLFTTQAVVVEYDFVLLEDDQNLQLPQHIVPVFRQEIGDEYGQDLLDVLNRVSQALTTDMLTQLNFEVEINQREARDVAREWLESQGFVPADV